MNLSGAHIQVNIKESQRGGDFFVTSACNGTARKICISLMS
ncbi:hypothetical protein M917_2220 [Psychrobacter aquaticus CMS 56]|uniref:Uncharacterized protein n=1 Tax=Psychrobacter aquaticus CMS 56 TaxID=1354303 RepID=U4T805_9GAMM|nr:hypothetical protein M917_2220 [Psychrobacter aquaticus CMS 56]